ncbi:MAG: ABC transporter substrate-binding protein [Chloroflexi bacterium]|nr:ABC transporter substrate-binding protein [Chloroflexota bacterium]
MKRPLRAPLWLPMAALLALLVAAAACNGGAQVQQPGATLTPSPQPPSDFPVTVTDSAGRSVTFDSAPRRIVALAPSFVEVLFAIGAGDALVAVDENTDFPPEAADLQKVSGFEPNVEAIGALEPDLVLIVFDPGGLRAALKRLGARVLLLASPDSLEGVIEQINLLGQVTGRADKAIALTGQMRERIGDVTAKLAGVQRGPRVFHEVSPDLYSAGPRSFVGDLYKLLKADNIATGAFPQLDNEAIITADPEVIILADEPAVTPAEVKARAGWGSISAVENDRVYAVDGDIISRPGPRIVDALEELARLLYPERFP